MEAKTRKEYERWLNDSPLTKEEKDSLLAIQNDEEAINDAFYRDLSLVQRD